MKRDLMKIIFGESLHNMPLTDGEIEIASKILDDLDGTLVIRAKLILKFCLDAVEYSKVEN